MSKSYETLSALLEKTMALHTSLILFEWDNETLAPEDAGSYTSRVIGILSEEYYSAMTGDEMGEAVAACERDKSLSAVEQAVVREAKEAREELVCIPAKEYRENAQLIAESARIWTKARKDGDFDEFIPTLEKVVDFKKKFASYRRKEGQKLYDIMLDENEKSFNTELLDEFFNQLKEEIVPLLREITDRGKEIDNSFLRGGYPEEKQRELARYLAEYIGFDFKKGVLSESAHPFTTNLHNHDVRITTSYRERMDASIFSVIHEAGHGVYELGIADDITQTPVGQGASMGMHESQSRFFENIIGRSPAFWVPLYEKLQEIFPEKLGEISREQFVEAVNKVEPSLIRTEADELTYSLHILIRYEMEKLIVEEETDLKKLPEIWADKYEEYLGVRPENPAEGVLQDIHWSQGLFGYFPSYALGNAFGAQLYYHMKKEMDIEDLLKNGKIEVIREFLRENVHKFGKLKTSRQILKDVTGEDFTPDYFIQYLTEKYRKLYELS
ncbi:carboxypeptidase M32 [Clostridium sp. Marseille-P2415]|uniref:carboxypeptidase M32 n=1 Tax=Clostridium sp. Marseille-P2415 TaxID=1805471 RepID=UPI0009883473|nr:carboxypeptidase M32 [Clostridium sp. Marseille-P2415]